MKTNEKLPSRKQNRLAHYNYSTEGCYFVTLCADKHIDYFGTIINEKVCLSDIGRIIFSCWKQIPKIYSHISLDYFIIMPNHLHGIICIDDCIDRNHAAHDSLAGHCPAPTGNADLTFGGRTSVDPRAVRPVVNRTREELPYVISKFKEAATKQSRKISKRFAWQRSYFEHIIRNEKSLYKIREYIVNNPLKAAVDY